MKRKNILVIFILIGLLSSFILSFNRINIESNNKNVDIILNFDEMKKLSEQSNNDLEWWLKKFKGLGASSVSLIEESFESMIKDEKPLKVELVDKMKQDIHWKENHSTELVEYLEQEKIDKYDLVAMTTSKELYEFIKKGLDERYSNKKFKAIESEEEYAFVLDGTIKEALYTQKNVLIDNENNLYSQEKELTSSSIMKLGLGYDEEKLDTIRKSGLEIVLRPLNFVTNWTGEKYVKTSLNEYSNLNIKPKYMIFTGGEILGYPKNVDLVKDFMKENDMKVALIESAVQREHIEQKGIENLTRDLNYNSVRIFSVPEFIQERYKYNNYEGAEEIENTLYRAVTERNIRAIYFNPFKLDKERYVTNYNEYEKTFNSFEERIAKHNMALGEASVMKENHINIVLKILLGIGILGGGILLIEELLKISDKLKKLLIILGVILILISSFVIPNFSNIVFAMASAIIFPSLSMIYFCKKLKYYYNSREDRTIKNSLLLGIKELIIMSLISSIGSIFVASVLSDVEFLLEMNIFRGVKLVQLIPIVVYLIAFIGYFGYKKEKNIDNNKTNYLELKEIFSDNIKIGYAFLAGVVLYIGYIYLARTGHETNIQPSNFEIMMRNLLELKLLARPRIKEFLLAFPAVMLAIDFARYRQKLVVFVLGLLVALGQTSIVNTFSHLRTPMYLSSARLVYGLIAGIIMGIIYLLIVRIGIKIIRFLRGEIFNE